MMKDSADIIKRAGLKLTPQRKMVYEAVMHLGHASVEEIVSSVQAMGSGMTVSTVYRILDSFCKANLLTQITHPGTGICYYDIKVWEHGHIFTGGDIMDYEDPDLTEMVRRYLEAGGNVPGAIEKVQIQITIKNQ